MSENDKLRIAVRKFDPFEKAIHSMWEAFCSETGCNFELEAVPMDLHPLYNSVLKTEGLKNGDWDIAQINTDWIAEAHASGAIENLSPFISAKPPEGFPNGWSASLMQMQQFEHQVYALPFHNGPECLIYRKDLFEAPAEKMQFEKRFGRALAPPRNWTELIEVAGFFQRPEENLYGTTFAAYPDGHNTVFDFCLQLWTRGGELLTEDGRVLLDSPKAVEGMEFYRSVLQNDRIIHPKSRDFDSVRSGMAFANGELAMMVNWFGFASMCEVYPESKIKGNVQIANVPAGEDGHGVSLNAYWMYVLGKGGKHKQLAYDFIRFAARADNDKLLTLEGGTGCRKSTWHDEEVNKTVPYYHKLETLHKDTRALPRMANWSQVADVIDQMVLGVMNTATPIDQLLKEAQTKIDKL